VPRSGALLDLCPWLLTWPVLPNNDRFRVPEWRVFGFSKKCILRTVHKRMGVTVGKCRPDLFILNGVHEEVCCGLTTSVTEDLVHYMSVIVCCVSFPLSYIVL
jgi:hypothetical protein